MEKIEQIESLIVQIASMINFRDDRTYTGKYSDLNADIASKKYQLERLLNEQ
jgi:hypothetical protein